MKFILKLLKYWNQIEEYTILGEEERELKKAFFIGYRTKRTMVKKIHAESIKRRLEMTNDRVNNLYTKLSVIIAVIIAVITAIVASILKVTSFWESIHFITQDIHSLGSNIKFENIVLIVLIYYLLKLIGLVYLTLLGQSYSYSTYKDLKCIETYDDADDFNVWQIYFDWKSSMKRAKLLNKYLELLLKNAGIVGVLFILLEILLK